ncbi:MAG: DNA-processing protein DprA [Clostridia bacterium]|nr:DNA-processing protein DprA [Clostridia bacterium]
MKELSTPNLITIQHIFGAGSLRAFKIYENIKSQNLLNNDIKTMLEKISFSEEVKIKLLAADYKIAENTIDLCKKHNVNILTIADKYYPEILKNIDVPPLVLYYKGELPNFDILPSITIVGPRKVSDYGKKVAFSLGYRLSKAGMIVVSGGALGCDTAAHEGALSTNGKTVMVLGCGIDAEYLMENKKLRDDTEKNGCIISEYPPLVKPTRHSFPIRNRIMSGLTLGTVIVEAPEKSGALITARCAMEQGRDVFVIPGSPSLKQYKGSNKLLRDGAKLLIDSSDIFGEYIPRFAEYLDLERAFSKEDEINHKKNIKKSSNNLQETLSNEAKIVYNYLDRQIFSIDDISECGLSSDEILSSLTELELENLIEPIIGGKYKLK